VQILLLPGQPPFHRQRAFLHLLRKRDDAIALFRQNETISSPLKQRLAGCPFKRPKAASDSRMAKM
jgi:hypothetical protein